MHIHKPKPVHSWRELATEIGVIVVGITIALGAEQVIEALHWRERVHEARRALSVELGEDLGQAQERVETAPCVERRLDQLEAVVDDATRTGRLAPMGAPGIPPTRSWDTGVWQSALSAQTATHMSSDELKAITSTYEFIDRISVTSLRELDAWTTLYGLAGPGRRFDSGEAAPYRLAIGEARFLDRFTALNGIRAQQMVRRHGIAYDAAQFAQYAGDDPRRRYPICQPPGLPPAHYGIAPMDTVIDDVLRHPAG
jgi:hypothetical protein